MCRRCGPKETKKKKKRERERFELAEERISECEDRYKLHHLKKKVGKDKALQKKMN